MNRRIFLKGVGGVALAAPFLSSLHEKEAKAQGTPPPRRSVIYHTHNGCLTNRWFPKVSNGTIDAAALEGTTLAGLASHADKLLFPRGVKMFNSYAEIQSVDPHDQAMGSKLTCATIETSGNRYATSHSMDHEIALQMNTPGTSPLVLSVAGGSGGSIKDILSFSGPGEAFPAQTNPQTVYNQLTQALGTGGGGETEADYRIKRGESVLDLVAGQLSYIKSQPMSMSDKQKIEAWETLLRSSEIPIAGMAGCDQATADEMGIEMFIAQAGTDSGGGSSVFGSGDVSEAAYKYGASAMFRLMALTMICDMNRSLIFTYPGYAVYAFLGHEHDHHGLSHRNGSFEVGGTCVTGVVDMIHQIDTFFAEKYVELVDLLKGIPEGDGTLLDNTATMWLPELADGNSHNTNNLPIVIAGSLGGYLKQGQSVNLDGSGEIDTGNSEANCTDGNTNNSNTFATSSRQGNQPINKLLLTIMNGCGCTDGNGQPMTEWGQFDSASQSAGITKPGEFEALRASS
jgi:hypothetical protein